MPPIAPHETPTTELPWDAGAAVKALKTPISLATGGDVFAWRDPDADSTKKAAWKFPHHEVSSAGTPGAANVHACTSGVGVLNGAMGGADIPDADRAGVHLHLFHHLVDAGVDKNDVPELKSRSRAHNRRGDANASCNRCSGTGSIDLGAGAITCPQCGGSGTGENNANPDPSSGDEDLSRGKRVRAGYCNIPETRVSPRSQFELREVPDGTGGTNLKFTGFASTTGDDATYEMEDRLGPWTESISIGAFKKTLDEGADVAFLLNHQGMTLARTKAGTLKLSEVTDGAKSPIYGITGLHSEAMLDPQNMYVQAMRSAVDRGDLDEMSFAFQVRRQEYNKDFTRRWIYEVSLDKGDISLVNYGANPHTGGTVTLRQRFPGRAPVGRLTPFGNGYEGRKAVAEDLALIGIRSWRMKRDRARVALERLRYPAWDK